MVLRCLHHSRAFHGVLLSQLGQYLVHVQPELGEAALRDFDIELFVLHAKQLDLGNIGHAQQLLAHLVGKLLDLGIAEAIGLQRIDHAEYVAKVVVEERALHALRQGIAHVAHLLAHVVPNVGDLVRARAVLDFQNDLRLARLGIAADLVGQRHLLQGALDLVGHLLSHLFGRGAGPVGAHHHGAEGKGRILVLAELKIGGNAHHHQHHHEVARQRGMVNGPSRQVKAVVLWRLLHGALTGSPKQKSTLQAQELRFL